MRQGVLPRRRERDPVVRPGRAPVSCVCGQSSCCRCRGPGAQTSSRLSARWLGDHTRRWTCWSGRASSCECEAPPRCLLGAARSPLLPQRGGPVPTPSLGDPFQKGICASAQRGSRTASIWKAGLHLGPNCGLLGALCPGSMQTTYQLENQAPRRKSPRALHRLKEYPNYLCNRIESYILLCLLGYDHKPSDNCPLLTT